MDQALANRIAHELGFTSEKVSQLRQMPFEQAVQSLNAMKQEAKANYRKLAFKYHPDRNQGSLEAEVVFKGLNEVLQHIDKLSIQPVRPVPQVQIQVIYHVPVHTQTTSSVSGVYDARRVAYIRFG